MNAIIIDIIFRYTDVAYPYLYLSLRDQKFEGYKRQRQDDEERFKVRQE